MLSITTYGAWVAVDGVGQRGLVLLPDLVWGRVGRVEEHVALGDRFEAVVLVYRPARGVLRVGRKQLTPDPWVVHREALREGHVLRARVISVVDYGVFAEVFDNVEVLVPEGHLHGLPGFDGHPSDVLDVGDPLIVWLETVRWENRRMEASLVPRPAYPQPGGPHASPTEDAG